MVGDTKQLDKILSIRDNLPDLKAIVMFDCERSNVPGVINWDQLLEIGRNTSDTLLSERLSHIAVNQCCVLSYTSGTTGSYKNMHNIMKICTIDVRKS